MNIQLSRIVELTGFICGHARINAGIICCHRWYGQKAGSIAKFGCQNSQMREYWLILEQPFDVQWQITFGNVTRQLHTFAGISVAVE